MAQFSTTQEPSLPSCPLSLRALSQLVMPEILQGILQALALSPPPPGLSLA